jgi:hypothetical protein
MTFKDNEGAIFVAAFLLLGIGFAVYKMIVGD